HRRDVNEDVLVACLGPDEPVALSRVEPLDGALLHRRSPGLLLSVWTHVAMPAARRATTRLLERSEAIAPERHAGRNGQRQIARNKKRKNGALERRTRRCAFIALCWYAR